MPLSKYNTAFGGKAGSAEEAHAAMIKTYGAKKGEHVFYATKNARMKSAGSFIKNQGYGDIGLKRQAENAKVGGFTDGHDVSAQREFAEGGDSGV